MQTKAITMVIRSLLGGGAERVMTDMANFWVAKGHAVHIITSTSPETDAYPLDPRVGRSMLPPSGNRTFPWSIKELRAEILRIGAPVVVSFMDRTNVPLILACRGIPVKTIIAERIDPTAQHVPLLRKFIVRVCYQYADALTVLTDNVKHEWAERFLPASKVFSIPNPVPVVTREGQLPAWLPKKYFCCTGRLHQQKGFDQLLDYMPGILKRYPEHHLVIMGEGSERKALTAQIHRLGLEDRVHMPGFISMPHAIMKHADLFLFPSRYEGFPNALVEAMSLGLPVVSFDCPSGPRCIIKDKINGRLLPANDMVSFTEAVHWMMENDQRRQLMGQHAQTICQTHSMERVMNAWEHIIDHLCGYRIPEPNFLWHQETV